MHKKLCLAAIFMLLITLCLPLAVSANMAAPTDADIGSSVTFAQNDAIAVLSEVLDIKVKGETAEISAVYRMKNTTAEQVSTPAMFLSPNLATGGVRVTLNGLDADISCESYVLSYSTEIAADDWQYAVLYAEQSNPSEEGNDKTVDAIRFEMTFAPGEEYDIVVSYTYRLGGYPDYDYDAKYGRIEYYLTPAAMWKDFANITINLTLDEEMPVITESSLAFEKTGPRTYRYQSDTLPRENLHITIDQTGFQNFVGFFKSPYLYMNLMIILPFLAVVLALVIIVFLIIRRLCRANKKKNG